MGRRDSDAGRRAYAEMRREHEADKAAIRRIVATEEALEALEPRVLLLEKQARCGIFGHTLTVLSREGDMYGFQCIDCKVQYTRAADRLSERERALVGVVESPG